MSEDNYMEMIDEISHEIKNLLLKIAMEYHETEGATRRAAYAIFFTIITLLKEAGFPESLMHEIVHEFYTEEDQADD